MVKQIFPVVAGAKPTILTNEFNLSSSSRITVESMDYIPNAPNHVTLSDENGYFVTIEYTEIDGNTISGISFIEGDWAHTFKIGSSVARTIDKYDMDALAENIIPAADHIRNKMNPHEVTKEQVGLGNVDNTADIDKPISTLMQYALDTKLTKETSSVDFKIGVDTLNNLLYYIIGE